MAGCVDKTVSCVKFGVFGGDKTMYGGSPNYLNKCQGCGKNVTT